MARTIKPPFDHIAIEGDAGIEVQWNVKLGRLAEGYARGGDYLNSKIRLAPGLLNGQARHALLHETMHKLWEVTGLEQWLGVKTEELVIDALAPWLVSVLRANPALVEFLLAED